MSERKYYKKQIVSLMDSINSRILERATLTKLIFLTIFSKHHIMLFGVPGVGKTYAINTIMQSIDGESAWEIVMSKETKLNQLIPEPQRNPQEVLTDDRCILSKKFIFLDEMFKGDQSVLNALLPVLNERAYQLSGESFKIPLNSVFSASNEIPSDEFIEPFRDRILFWYDVKLLENNDSKKKFYQQKFDKGTPFEKTLNMEDVEYVNEYISKTDSLKLNDDMADIFAKIVNQLRKSSIKISDRKTGGDFILKALKTSAVLNDRDHVDESDLLLIKHCSWTNLSQRVTAFEAVENILFGSQSNIQAKIFKTNANLNRTIGDFSIKTSDLLDLGKFLSYNDYKVAFNFLKEYKTNLDEISKQIQEIEDDMNYRNSIVKKCLDNIFIGEDVYSCKIPYSIKKIQDEINNIMSMHELKIIEVSKFLDTFSSYEKYQFAYDKNNEI